MAKKPQLQRLNLLIVDPDVRLAEVCAQTLRTMGFGTVTQVRNAESALAFIERNPVDIMITETPMGGVNGTQLIQEIRRMKDISKRILSIIMLTAQSEIEDVKAARDAGINEFMVKPFTAKALYTRLEQVIENPRSFVLANDFVGPDRRRRHGEPDKADKRVAPPAIEKSSDGLPKKIPVALTPEFELKKKIELEGKLATFITPVVLQEAQETIESFKADSHHWITEDIEALLHAQKQLATHYSPALLDEMMRLCLSIKARTSMYGHGIVAEVAQLFYKSLRSEYQPGVVQHHLISQKYAESLHAAFASNMTARDIKMGQALVQDLKRLSQKFAEA